MSDKPLIVLSMLLATLAITALHAWATVNADTSRVARVVLSFLISFTTAATTVGFVYVLVSLLDGL